MMREEGRTIKRRHKWDEGNREITKRLESTENTEEVNVEAPSTSVCLVGCPKNRHRRPQKRKKKKTREKGRTNKKKNERERAEKRKEETGKTQTTRIERTRPKSGTTQAPHAGKNYVKHRHTRANRRPTSNADAE